MKFNEDLTLAELNIFTNRDIGILKEYNISTIGQLLGATAGLANLELFKMMEGGEGKTKLILDIVPQLILEHYRTYENKQATGLLVKTEDEEDNNERE